MDSMDNTTTMNSIKPKEVIRCVLHVDSNVKEDINRFTDEQWLQIQTVAQERLRIYSDSSKYFRVCTDLPSENSIDIGYHRTCYRRFNSCPAVTPVHNDNVDSTSHAVNNPPQRVSRSTVQKPIVSSSGVFGKTCIFCNALRKCTGSVGKQYEYTSPCETFEAADKIKQSAILLQDSEMLTKIGNIDLIAKEVHYHNRCKKQYTNKADRCKKKEESSDFDESSDIHEKCFQLITEYTQNNILNRQKSELLTSVHSRYKMLFLEKGKITTLSARNLEEKLVTCFNGKLRVCKSSNRCGNVLYNSDLNENIAMENALLYSTSPEAQITESALTLRYLILEQTHMTNNDITKPVTSETLKTNQPYIPELLEMFFRALYTGKSTNTDTSQKSERLVKSIASDTMYAVTGGIIKPYKHVCLGLSVKSLTGSRKMIEILNRLGHSIGYGIIEEIETALAETIADRNTFTPDGMIPDSTLNTGIAWDNYDEQNETLSGSSTLHDTVGICFQNIPDNACEISSSLSTSVNNTSNSEGPTKSKRPRKFELAPQHIAPYRSKPKITEFKYDIKSICEKPYKLDLSHQLDIAWSVSCMTFADTPMWIGWNSLVCDENLPRQKVLYMSNINLPPTRLDVVAETLKRSQQVALECGEDYITVTYDLAVAKPALQIQAKETPLYDNVFICFGAFHILMAYFGTLGHIIDGSGGPEILRETEVLASGSLNGFITGKMYNRCKRLHPMLATAFRILHLRQFASLHPLSQEILDELAKLKNRNDSDAIRVARECLLTSPHFKDFIDRYAQFSDDTRAGKYGTTARYWLLYIDLVDLYLLFSRASRTCDVDLFVYALGKMSALFFVTGRINYARWMVKYHLNLLNIDHTHPGLRKKLEDGGLSIRRTNKKFSGTAIDQTLEQTVNADAASRTTGITAFSLQPSASNRWMITRSVRSKIIGELYRITNMTKEEDTTQDLQGYRIKRDNDDLNKIVNGITDRLNPFADNANDNNLYNVMTGRSCSTNVKNELLNATNEGEVRQNTFRNECFNDPLRFEKPIKRTKVKNFASDSVKVKITGKNQKIKEIQATLDIFGRLLYLSMKARLDFQNIMSFPVTPVPYTLAHLDGTMCSTPKATLQNKLEKMVDSVPPSNVDVCVIDAMYFLRCLTDLPTTYGGIAKTVLSIICKCAKRVDFVADTYNKSSIKDLERGKRGDEKAAEFVIVGPEQTRPKNMSVAMKSGEFKAALLRFFVDEWQKNTYRYVLNGTVVYYGVEQSCYRYEVIEGEMSRTVIPELECVHDEADTRITYHIRHINSEMPTANIVVRANDTDILIILLYHSLTYTLPLWMDVGKSSDNTRRYISITQLSTELGDDTCRALPGFHSFTGSDYTASFIKKGKSRPYDIMSKSNEYKHAFAELGSCQIVSEETMSKLESFTCEMYGKKNSNSVNTCRYNLICDMIAPDGMDHPLEKLKKADPCNLPPCLSVLKKKVHRTNYVTSMWKNANLPNSIQFPAENNGWITKDGILVIDWFEGQQMPDEVFDVSHDIDQTVEDDSIAYSDSDSDSDSDQ